MTDAFDNYLAFLLQVDDALRTSGYRPGESRRMHEYFDERLPIDVAIWLEKTEQDLEAKQFWRSI